MDALVPGSVLAPHAEEQISWHASAENESRRKATIALLSVREPNKRPLMRSDITAYRHTSV